MADMNKAAPKWVDTTSYSRGKRGKVDPSEWRVSIGHLTIALHRKLHLDGWFVTCRMLGVVDHALAESTADWAKERALRWCRTMAVATLADVDTIIASNPLTHGVSS